MTLRKAKVLLHRFDVICRRLLLTVVWLNTSFRLWRTMKLRPSLSLYGQTYLVDDETFYGKGVKKALPERGNSWNTWLVSVAVLVETEPIIVRKTQRKWAIRASL